MAHPRRTRSTSDVGNKVEHTEQVQGTLGDQKSVEGVAPCVVLPDVEEHSKSPTDLHAEGPGPQSNDRKPLTGLKEAELKHCMESFPDAASAGGPIVAADSKLLLG